jgi:DNA integrity scanning protein DisA with diadenylate cyclase activity
MLRFNLKYFSTAVLLLVTELLIGFYLRDKWIRPYGGDVLVVILIYCTVKAFADTPVLKTTIGVFVFAFTIELLQYFHVVTVLGLQHNNAARTIIGTSFSVGDLVCYTLGIIIILFTENLFNHEPVFRQ